MVTEAFLLNVAFVTAGFVAHILKKAGTEDVHVFEYLGAHKARTYTALSTMVAAFATLYMANPGASAMEFFAIGYMAESLINRTPSNYELEKHRKNKGE